MVHYAKVDRWLAWLLGIVALLDVAAGTVVLAASLVTGEPEILVALLTALMLIGTGCLFGLILWALYQTRYEITPSELVIRCGPLRIRLPLERILEVFPTRNPLSAPAPSLDRLRINYRRKNGKKWFALISPKDKAAFIRDLVSAAPHLQSANDAPLRLRAVEPA